MNSPSLPSQPLLEHLGIRPVAVSMGESEFEIVVQDFHLRSGGIAHGGLYAAIMDAITGFAACGFIPPGCEMMTIQLNLNMTGTARSGDHLLASARARHAGKSTAVASGEIRRRDGKLLATGSATLLFVPKKRLKSLPPRRARRKVDSRPKRSSSVMP